MNKYFIDNNIDSPYKLLEIMNMINYGYTDKQLNIYEMNYKNFDKTYILQSFDQILKTKVGICWDQVEFEREFFSNQTLEFETYFIVHYDDKTYPTHTFLIYKENDKWYWFEHSWDIYKGIYEYNDKESLLKDLKDKFIRTLDNFKDDYNNLCLYRYTKPKSGISCLEFYRHCESGENIRSI